CVSEGKDPRHMGDVVLLESGLA
ncbi:hypothetical protein CSUI_006372, partial [Cystoisospora suis]